MTKKPDLHYEGELTKEFIDDLLSKIRVAIHYLENKQGSEDWENCKYNWLESLKYAALRCVTIQIKLDKNIVHREDEDHKCIDITLCILRDFEHAKSKDFINEVE